MMRRLAVCRGTCLLVALTPIMADEGLHFLELSFLSLSMVIKSLVLQNSFGRSQCQIGITERLSISVML